MREKELGDRRNGNGCLLLELSHILGKEKENWNEESDWRRHKHLPASIICFLILAPAVNQREEAGKRYRDEWRGFPKSKRKVNEDSLISHSLGCGLGSVVFRVAFGFRVVLGSAGGFRVGSGLGFVRVWGGLRV